MSKQTNIIVQMPPELSNKIAAGEVVQRPASIVKELLDNALDAGADEIRVEVAEAGKTLIRVTDNGCGMTSEDAVMAFERHATSKIRTMEDLFRIRTMGFRGEALSSIASVSNVEMKTRRMEDEVGTRVTLSGGQHQANEPAACPAGTSITVENLFFNVPARRQFLKTDATELKHILKVFQSVAIAHPDIALTFTNRQDTLYELPAQPLDERISSIFGREYLKSLIPFEEETSVVRVSGVLADPKLSKRSRGEQFLFVNGRPFQHRYLTYVILSQFDAWTKQNEYPFYAIFVDVDPSSVDVNVHPSKTEVKFEDERTVIRLAASIIKKALNAYFSVPLTGGSGLMAERAGGFSFDGGGGAVRPGNSGSGFDGTSFDGTGAPDLGAPASGFDASSAGSSSLQTGRGDEFEWGKSGKSIGAEGDRSSRREIHIPSRINPPLSPNELKQAGELLYGRVDEGQEGHGASNDFTGSAKSAGSNPASSTNSASDSNQTPDATPTRSTTPASSAGLSVSGTGAHRTFWQLHQSYIVTQTRSGLCLVDQHAAHKRILYEKALRATEEDLPGTQQLLFAQTVELSASDFLLLKELIQIFQKMGFHLSLMSGHSVMITGVPSDIESGAEKEVLVAMLSQYRELEQVTSLDRRKKVALSYASRSAIRKGRPLQEKEMELLMDQLFACEEPYLDPLQHPTLVYVSMSEIDRRFRR